MNSRNKYVFERFSSPGQIRDIEYFRDDIIHLQDPAFSENIDSYMKALSDIDEIKNDPSLNSIIAETQNLVASHINKASGKRSSTDLSFIKNSLSEIPEEQKVKSEIDEIRAEATKNGVYEQAEEWVNDFCTDTDHKNNPGYLERKSFIAAGLSSGKDSMPEATKLKSKMEKPSGKRFLVRILSLSAAAVIAAMFLIKSFAPSSDPGKIYLSYYKPFKTFSTITRGEKNSSASSLKAGIYLYKSGDYKEAKNAFSKTAESGMNSSEVLFLLGLANLETGNYENAVNNFKSVINEPGQYTKDAKWYLGLTYLRTGDTAKASEQFESLSKSKGFYMKNSQKILRRLR